MPAKRKTTRPAAKKAAARKASDEARAAHDRGVLVRGEAARADKSGKLPKPFTHEIVDGKLVRRRYFVA